MSRLSFNFKFRLGRNISLECHVELKLCFGPPTRILTVLIRVHNKDTLGHGQLFYKYSNGLILVQVTHEIN